MIVSHEYVVNASSLLFFPIFLRKDGFFVSARIARVMFVVCCSFTRIPFTLSLTSRCKFPKLLAMMGFPIALYS